MAYNRIDRISEEVRRELDKLIREDLRDPRFSGTFSITHADVTRDLRYCKVYVSVLEPEKRKGVMDALKSAAGFLRRELGHRVDLRYTPELIFELDTIIASLGQYRQALAQGDFPTLRQLLQEGKERKEEVDGR